MKATPVLVALLALVITVPMFGETYKDTYTVPCNQLWGAVKDTLGNAGNYNVKKSDDAKMTASYDVRHAAHVTITGALLQRTNRVTLVPSGTGCEMQVVSNYSGFELNDRGDFKTRVDESLAKPKAENPAEATAPADSAK